MAIDTKHEDLQGLRIDRSAPPEDGEPSPWAKRIIVIGIVRSGAAGLVGAGVPAVFLGCAGS